MESRRNHYLLKGRLRNGQLENPRMELLAEFLPRVTSTRVKFSISIIHIWNCRSVMTITSQSAHSIARKRHLSVHGRGGMEWGRAFEAFAETFKSFKNMAFLSHVNAFATEKFRDSKDVSVESSWKFFSCAPNYYTCRSSNTAACSGYVCQHQPQQKTLHPTIESVANAYE